MRITCADLHEDEVFILGRLRCIAALHRIMIEHDDLEVGTALSHLFDHRALLGLEEGRGGVERFAS